MKGSNLNETRISNCPNSGGDGLSIGSGAPTGQPDRRREAVDSGSGDDEYEYDEYEYDKYDCS